MLPALIDKEFNKAMWRWLVPLTGTDLHGVPGVAKSEGVGA